nr:hypothetical protein BaRGS_003162 [Batillaria attramentaria]
MAYAPRGAKGLSCIASSPKVILDYHAGRIVACAVSPVTHLVMTLGEDGSVRLHDFLQKVVIAVIHFKAAGCCMVWVPLSVDHKCASVLCGFADGGIRLVAIDGEKTKLFGVDKFVCKLKLAQALKHTAVDSLQHHDVRYREFKFSSIKSQLRHDEELDVIRKEEEARQKAIEEDDRRLLGVTRSFQEYTRGMETPSQQNLRKEQEREKAKIAKIKQEEEDKKKPQWKPYMPPHPSPILQVLYLESNARFWVSMGDYDAGYLYECELPRYYSHVANLDENDEGPSAKPVRAVPVADSDDVPIRVIRFNSEGTCAFFGMQNGRIRLQFLEVEFDLASPSFYWTIAAHDVTNGAITGMELSHDESFLMTVGDDGNFFIFSLLPITQLLEEIKEHKAKLPPAEPDFRPGVDLEPGQYTIEQAKQKTDYDRMVKEAEKNKSEKRITIAQLRARFRRLWLDNMQLPAQHRLTKDEFLMDEGRLREMREETEEKLREMKRQLAWDSEKAQLSYQKIHGRYRKHLTQDRFAVRAFLTDHVIWSYRTQDEPEEVVYEVAVEEEDDKLEQSRCERKRRKREARRKQWEVFMQTKPDDDYADPADLRAIQIAKDTIGDFKLKSSSDYIVPDSYKLTLRDARARLKTCEEHLLGLQTRFNQRLLALRDEKAEIVQDINGMIGRLKEISQDIAYKHFRQVPLTLRLTHDEQPENHFSFTKADLLDLKKRLAEEEKRRQEHEQAELGLTSPSAAQAATHQQQAKRRSSHVQRMSHPKLSRVHSVVAKISAPKKSVESSHEESVAETAEESSDSSDMLEELAEIDDIKLKYEQDTLHNTIRRKKLLFDIEHRLLRHEKFRLDLLAKMGDLRTTTLTEEKILMRDCESVETAIRTRISQSYEQKTEMERNLRQLKQNAEKQTSELDKCAKKEKALLAQLDAIIGEKNPFRDFLIKVYKKKIKRKPKKEGTEGEEGEEESSSESSSEDESEEEEDEDDDDQVFYDLSTCPQGCSQEKFDEVVQLRESRLDLDEQMLEFKRMRDGFLKETEGIKKKKIAVDFTLEKANKELGLFQTEKQKRVNSLDVLTLLQFHQLKCLRRHDMPPDLVELLNLNESDLFRLQNRIRELKQEMRIQKRNMFESRKLHAHLQYERRHFQEKLAEMSKICDDSMMKKLGKIVHMEILDNVVCDLELEEAKLKLSKSRKVCEEEIKLLDAEHKELVQDHTNLMLRIDSEMCLQKASLMDRHMTYTRNLDTMVSSMRMRYEDTQIKLPKDIEELISVIAQQRVALQALGREIDYLTNGPKPVMKRTDYD